MRVSSNVPDEFRPVELNITLESEEELNVFYAIFDYADICEFMRKHMGEKDPGGEIRKAIEEAHGVVPDYIEVHSAPRHLLFGDRKK